jgi:hypothetical protein
MGRRARLKTLDLERVLILDRGNVEVALPRGWTVRPDPEGHLACVDPTDSCKLEVSYFPLPPLDADAPSMAERVRSSLEGAPDPSTRAPVVAFRRGDAEFAWTDYAFTSDDTERDERREAHGRLLLAGNQWFQAVFTFSYWTDDAAWAVPVWERIVQTIELGDGVPLETPRDHWSLRDV